MSSANNRRLRWLLPALFAGATLAGCADADLYLDRRDTIALSAGDAVASNIIVQTVDPWPRVAGNRDIPGNGDRMQAAGERYRTGKIIAPRGTETSSVGYAGGGGSDTGGSAAK